ncbi:DUF3558 family protein [Rhodococcus sp. BP-332]|uniref:DUF3558 family protein n=1 Tax=Rhodococcus sp. BP-332 TaxID=2739447 RepID=UPI001C9B44EE|nr:DUF3558 family protein [Rhodococcus sp. BP-332]MBY6676608.1 DUF3558 family protein [Rhodococcus sp. BP-332]
MAALVFCGACSPGVSGEPVAELWDPCTIPSDALRKAGVTPEALASGTVDHNDNDWLYCSYRQGDHVLSISSTHTSMDTIASNTRASGLTSEEVSGRGALVYSELVGTSDETCYVTYGTTFGAIEFAVNTTGTDEGTATDLCDSARHFAGTFEELTPQ